MVERPGNGLVCKLLRPAEWSRMQCWQVLHGSADDRRDGFIHLSTQAQVRATAKKWFAADDRLMLLLIDPATLGPALQWEPAKGGSRLGLFPHLYAPLPLDLVHATMAVPRHADGGHVFPEGIP